MAIYSVSVRNIVEFILRRGDIDSAAMLSAGDMLLGTKIHRKLQKQAAKVCDYTPEVRLDHTFFIDGLSIKVQGIADGIIRQDGFVTVDEIKSTSFALCDITDDFSYLHSAQVDFYAYFICFNEKRDSVKTRLCYCNIDTEELRYIEKEKSFKELESFVLSVVKEYAKWIRFKIEHEEERDLTAKALKFPFNEFRQGQREAAAYIYKTIRDEGTVFVQAPTGIGKTISALFPSIKAMGEGYGEKVFYLTAKTTTAAAAENALTLMCESGLTLKAISITSKEKICGYQKQCTPEKCPYAGGHFDRINDAVFELVTSESIITKETVLKYAEKHRVCPFELTLDASEWCDVTIGDFNYAFDPTASLKRYFEQGGDYVVLCDEAHNLAERGREMFSAQISKKAVLNVIKELKDIVFSEKKELLKRLKKINAIMLKQNRELGEEQSAKTEKPAELYDAIFMFCDKFSAYLAEKKGKRSASEAEKNALELYFDCLSFLSVYENAKDEYVYFTSKSATDTITKLFCVDPSRLISETCGKCRAVVFFSATLLPKEYYTKLLGGKGEAEFIRLPSPFARDNLMISIYAGVSARFKDRERSLRTVVKIIYTATRQKGNHIIFFPSFAYMTKALEAFKEAYPDVETLEQKREMSEDDRRAFLDKFVEAPTKTLVAFAVAGGVFSEGVDLVGTRLSGVVIIGTGLPQICFERDMIREYFDKKFVVDKYDINAADLGFTYAYEYPGFNRVLQAAGRVIRSETDVGTVLLADDRWQKDEYRRLFPPEWFADSFEYVYDIPSLQQKFDDFWSSKNK